MSRNTRQAIGIDIGGTKICAAVVDQRGIVHDTVTVATPRDMPNADLVRMLALMADSLTARFRRVKSIGVGAAGAVDWTTGVVKWAPNNTYSNFPLRQLLQDEAGLPVVVDNDANTAGWAEAQINHSQPYRNMAFLTIGTGVGAALIIDGRLHRGRNSLAGEAGHMIVAPSGHLCGCGRIGCLEAMASGTALTRIGNALLSDERGSLQNLSGHDIYAAAQSGSAAALTAFDQVGHWLGLGIANLVNLLDLDVVVIGGGLVETGDLLLEPVRRSVQENTFAVGHRPAVEILASSLGKEAGVIGAALLALAEYPTAGLSVTSSAEADRKSPRRGPTLLDVSPTTSMREDQCLL